MSEPTAGFSHKVERVMYRERTVQARCHPAHREHGRASHGKHEVRCCRPPPESEVHRTASSSRGGTEMNDLNAILTPGPGIHTRH